jgi:hypothetical protein
VDLSVILSALSDPQALARLEADVPRIREIVAAVKTIVTDVKQIAADVAALAPAPKVPA